MKQCWRLYTICIHMYVYFKPAIQSVKHIKWNDPTPKCIVSIMELGGSKFYSRTSLLCKHNSLIWTNHWNNSGVEWKKILLFLFFYFASSCPLHWFRYNSDACSSGFVHLFLKHRRSSTSERDVVSFFFTPNDSCKLYRLACKWSVCMLWSVFPTQTRERGKLQVLEIVCDFYF